VENPSKQQIFFSIGGHPAFMCPLKPDCKFDDYYFEFEQPETLDRMMLTEKGFFVHETVPFMKNEQQIQISHELFKDDAIVVQPQKSKAISVKSKKHQEYMTFYFNDFPYLGLWSPAEPAPFVCIEPWFGHADYADFTGDISQKAGIVALNAGKSFCTSYAVAIFE
jgi:galactose mutarotase-like enzyme